MLDMLYGYYGGLGMARVEVCHIVDGWEKEQEANRWVEARLTADQGERVVKRVEYWDERYRGSYPGYGLPVLFSPAPGENVSEGIRASEELDANG
jgi:hypothetical protein